MPLYSNDQRVRRAIITLRAYFSRTTAYGPLMYIHIARHLVHIRLFTANIDTQCYDHWLAQM